MVSYKGLAPSYLYLYMYVLFGYIYSKVAKTRIKIELVGYYNKTVHKANKSF